MEVKIDRDAFAKALGRAQGVVERRHTMPVLANALLSSTDDHMDIVVTDLEICMRATVPGVTVSEPGRLTVNARKLYEVVKELPAAEVEVRSTENEWVEIRSGRATFHIAGLPADDFPTIPSTDDIPWHTVAEARLGRCLELVSYAISNDETRYHLNGIYVESEDGEVRFVATDGHRLSYTSESADDMGGLAFENGVIIPRKAVQELRKLLDGNGEVEVGFGKNHGSMRKGHESLLFQYVDGEFPDYRRVIPKGNDIRLEIDKEALLKAIQRVSLISADRSRGIRLGFTEGEARVSANHPDVGDAAETVECGYSGEDLAIGFNASYLVDVLKVIGTDRVDLGFKDGASQGTLREVGNDRFLAIVMPMRI